MYALATWDPDGAGPAPLQWLVGGVFTRAGGTSIKCVASFDPTTGSWSPLGAGLDHPQIASARAFATMPNGELVVGGSFDMAGSTPANSVAVWDGVSWAALGTGANGFVYSLVTLANGDLVAGGSFTAAGGVAGTTGIARWDGAAWQSLGGGLGGIGGVRAISLLPSGMLIAAGEFSSIGGVAATNIASWNGTTWSPLASGLSGILSTLTLAPGGDLIAGGRFTIAGGGTRNVARWDGTTWSWMGTAGGHGQTLVNAVAALPSGEVIAGGRFTDMDGVAAESIALWNGTAWSPLAGGIADSNQGTGTVFSLLPLPTGEVLVGGAFMKADTLDASGLARWEASSWSTFGPGNDGPVWTLHTLGDGNIVAGGAFTHIENASASRIAQWNGTSWSPMGAGLRGGTPGIAGVAAAVELANGDLIAGGDFTHAGSVAAANIARWDGAAWSALGSGMFHPPSFQPLVQALTELQSGDVVAAGQFTTAGGVTCNGIARWDGSSWHAMGGGVPGAHTPVFALAVLPNGDLVAGGAFPTMDGVTCNGIARWDGSSWHAMGTGASPGRGVAVLSMTRAGTLLAAGDFTTMDGALVNHVACWDGVAWSPLGTGTAHRVAAVQELPNGDLIAATWLPGWLPAGGCILERWDGVSWQVEEVAATGESWQGVTAFALHDDGTLLVAGNFPHIGAAQSPAPYLARLAPTCPALASEVGAGCNGAAGLNALHATSLPWLGTTSQAVASGMPSNSLTVRVLGLAALTIPLTVVLPQAAAGCTLLATPDYLDVHLPVNGTTTVSFAIPPSLALVGVVVQQQVAAFELGTLGSILSVTSTNALSLTIGAL